MFAHHSISPPPSLLMSSESTLFITVVSLVITTRMSFDLNTFAFTSVWLDIYLFITTSRLLQPAMQVAWCITIEATATWSTGILQLLWQDFLACRVPSKYRQQYSNFSLNVLHHETYIAGQEEFGCVYIVWVTYINLYIQSCCFGIKIKQTYKWILIMIFFIDASQFSILVHNFLHILGTLSKTQFDMWYFVEHV